MNDESKTTTNEHDSAALAVIEPNTPPHSPAQYSQ